MVWFSACQRDVPRYSPAWPRVSTARAEAARHCMGCRRFHVRMYCLHRAGRNLFHRALDLFRPEFH